MVPLSYLPEYVERGGQQVWRPPYSAREIELYGFVIEADPVAIDALLARDLIHPSQGAVDYRCAHAHVIVTFGRIGHEASLDPIDSQRGYLVEREVSIWCLVADVFSNRLLWYLPYIFTDSEQTIATGRELFGYPKQLGYFDQSYPQALGPAGGETTVTALSIDPFSPDSEAITRKMISVRRQAGEATAQAPAEDSIAAELGSLFPGGFSVDPTRAAARQRIPSAAIRHPSAPAPQLAAPVPHWVRGVLDALEGRSLTGDPSEMIADMVQNTTLVFLKQFRDASCPTKACYQSVVEAPISFDPAGASYQPLDPSVFELTVQSWASHPIADELGIPKATAIAPARAFHTGFGFDIELGLEVWRAPT